MFYIKFLDHAENASLGHSYHDDGLKLVLLGVVPELENVYVILVQLLNLSSRLTTDVEELVHSHSGDGRLHGCVELLLTHFSRRQRFHVAQPLFYNGLPGRKLLDPLFLFIHRVLLLELILSADTRASLFSRSFDDDTRIRGTITNGLLFVTFFLFRFV